MENSMASEIHAMQEDKIKELQSKLEVVAKKIESLKATVAGKDKLIAMLRGALEGQDKMEWWEELFDEVCERRHGCEVADGSGYFPPSLNLTEDAKKALTATPSEVDDWWKLELGKVRAEGLEHLKNMLTFTSRVGYSQTYQDQKNKAIEFVRFHTPKPDESIPPSKEGS